MTESVIVSKKSGALADELRRPLILLQKFSARTVSCADRDLAVDGSVLKDHSYLLECSQHSPGGVTAQGLCVSLQQLPQQACEAQEIRIAIQGLQVSSHSHCKSQQHIYVFVTK